MVPVYALAAVDRGWRSFAIAAPHASHFAPCWEKRGVVSSPPPPGMTVDFVCASVGMVSSVRDLAFISLAVRRFKPQWLLVDSPRPVSDLLRVPSLPLSVTLHILASAFGDRTARNRVLTLCARTPVKSTFLDALQREEVEVPEFLSSVLLPPDGIDQEMAAEVSDIVWRGDIAHVKGNPFLSRPCATAQCEEEKILIHLSLIHISEPTRPY